MPNQGAARTKFELGQSQTLLEKIKGRAAALRWAVLSLPPSFLPAHTRCPALVPCSAAGCAILHAPPPCLSTGGRIGCDPRSRFSLPTVCLLVRDALPPHPFQASTPVCACILPHRPRDDIGARLPRLPATAELAAHIAAPHLLSVWYAACLLRSTPCLRRQGSLFRCMPHHTPTHVRAHC